MRFLDKAVPDPGARAEIAEELRAMRGMAPALGQRAQPLTMALADTHPGNFIVDRPASPGSSISRRCMSARPRSISRTRRCRPRRCGIPTSAGVLSRAEVQGFYDVYLERIGSGTAEALRPWLVPMRRLTWLRTTLFMARWRVETRAPRDPANPIAMERCRPRPAR